MATEPDGNSEKKDLPNPADGAPETAPPASTIPASTLKDAPKAANPLDAKSKTDGAPKKKWVPQQPLATNKWVWRLVFGATFLAMLLLGVIVLLLINTKTEVGPPKLAEEFRDPVNNYSIHPPVNWWLEDPHDGHNFYIKGPRERGYMPLMMIYVDVAPGHLDSYMKEYVGRLKVEDKTVNVISETREKIDNFDASRLVYSWSMLDSSQTTVNVKTVQFIVADAPRFYRVTCSVREDLFEQYLPRFEASARSFHVLPLNTPHYNVINPGK